MNNPLLATGIFLFSFTLPLQAQTTSFSSTDEIDHVHTFGDSLSDPGNLFDLTGGVVPQSPPYAQRFSNGELWIEDLASDLGLAPTLLTDFSPVSPASDGINFAIGGASTGLLNTVDGSPTGVLAQIGIFESFLDLPTNIQPESEALYVLLAGANDYAGGAAIPRATDISEPIGNIEIALRTLNSLGAQNFLVSNLPDLALTPRFSGTDEAGEITATIAAHNLALTELLERLQNELPGTNLIEFDVNSLFVEAIANPSGFGFTNVDTPCLTNFSFPIDVDGFDVCDNPNETFFWDDFHPTTAVHSLFAEAALETFDLASVPEPAAPVSVPEPASPFGVLVGVGLGVAWRRKTLRRAEDSIGR